MSRSGDGKGVEGALQGVVHPGLTHRPEVAVGVDEAHGVSGPDRSIAQGLGQEALAHAGGSHQQDTLTLVEKLQGEGGVQQTAVQGD